jgi:hypothetical protein
MVAKEHGYGRFEKGEIGGEHGGWQQGRSNNCSSLS